MDDEYLENSPIFEFNRPHLYMGGDRELVLSSLLLAIILVVVLQNIVTAILGIIIAVVSVMVLRGMAKVDPLLRMIYLRYKKYQSFYPAYGIKNRR